MPKIKSEPTAEIKEKKATRSIKNMPIVEIDGDTVKRFNEAKDQIASAQKIVDALAPTLQDEGLKAVFKHNILNKADATLQISSVRLQDRRETPMVEGEAVETVMFSWTRKAKKCDSKRVEGFFDGLKTVANKPANREDYAGWILGSEFNTDVFIDPATKKFSQERCDKFVKALEKVSKDLDVENPLSTFKVMGPKPEFFIKRFTDFNLVTNLELAEVLPTSLTLEPVRPDKEEGTE